MSTLRGFIFDWLFNASVQIGLFAILAAALSPLVAKAEAKYQHCLYLAVFALCLAAPVFNTLWQGNPSVKSEMSPQQPTEERDSRTHALWTWNWSSKAPKPLMPAPATKTGFVALWEALLLYQMIRFGRGVYRVHRLRRDANAISPNEIGMAISGEDCSRIALPHRVRLLESSAIDGPITVGVFDPAIILPSKLMLALDNPDLTAIFAHECGHIRRKDYLVLLLCQLATIPLAWHPGIQYLMSKISQTRELACDEYAAVRLGKRITYARTLLRLASLCLQEPRSNAMGLGIFDGDNLEDRIMTLTQKRKSLSRAGLIGLALTTSFLLCSGAVIARAVSLQEPSASDNTAQRLAGTWHWMFQGHSFATMVLVQNGSGITGTVTESRISLADDGALSKADPSDNRTPAQITRTKLEGSALRVTVGDGNQPFEFLVTLTDASHAEIHPIGAPANMKPIQAERVQ